MTSVSTNFSGRRVLWGIWVAAQVCVACSDPMTRSPIDTSPDSAGANSKGGFGGCDAGLAGALDDCAAGASGGNAGSGGNLGSAGKTTTGTDAGAGGTPEAGSAGVSDAAGAAGTPAGADGGTGGAQNPQFVPAPHQPYPLVTYHGGPVIANIDLVSVYFGDDPLRDDLERFNTWIVASNYWAQAGAQYGVHAGTHRAPVQFESALPSPIYDTQIASWIAARVADGSLPKPSTNTVFALFFQAETKILAGPSAAPSCGNFAGIHQSAAIANPVFTGKVPFVVIPRCSFSSGDEQMIATNAASHELFEAATDPLSSTSPAWQLDGQDGTPLEAWQMVGGLELSDLCESHYYDEIDGFTVQRLWSNEAARADDNPCQPSDPKLPFFSVSADATIYHAQPGTTLTIHARAWSNQATSEWELGINWGYVPWGNFDGHATLSQTIVNNGDEITATVTIPPNPPIVDGRSAYRFTIDSIDPINPNFANPWPFLILVP